MIIRYSMIQAFLECPKMFYRKYILNETDITKSSALEFGTAMHLAIRNIVEEGEGISVFSMYWDSLKDADMKYYRFGWQELRDLACNKFLPNFTKSHAKKFSKSIHEETIEVLFTDSHSLQGTFDICGYYEGKLTLSDWKTSTKEYTPSVILKNPQMYIYAALYQQKYNILPEQLMYKVFIKSEGRIQTLKAPLTQEILDCQMDNVRNIVNSMLYTIRTEKWYCNYNFKYCDCNKNILID